MILINKTNTMLVVSNVLVINGYINLLPNQVQDVPNELLPPPWILD